MNPQTPETGLRRLRGYGFAAAAVAVAVLARWGAPGVLEGAPFLAFYPAVVVAAVLGGIGPGVLATLASALCVGLLYDPTPGWSHFRDAAVLARLGLFLAGGIGTSLAVGAIHASRAYADQRNVALQESEWRFRGTFENAAVGITHTDLQGRWLRINQKLCDILGYSRAELLDRSFPDITHPEDVDKDWQQYEQMVQGKLDHYHVEKRYLRKDGNPVWVRISRSLQRDENGHPLYAINIVEDITLRKQAETNERLSDDRYRSLVQASAQAVWVATPEGEIVEDSPSWRAITGQSHEQFRGYGWVDALHPDDRQRVAELWRSAVRLRRLYEVEYRLQSASGGYRHMAARAVPVLNDDGSIREWVGMNTDISEHMQAEEGLRESEQRFRAFFQNAAVGAAQLDQEMRLLEVNDRFCQLTGYSRGELLGKSPLDLVHPDDRDADARLMHDLFTSDSGVYQSDKRYIRKDGQLLWVHVTAGIIRDAGGNVVRTAAIVEDITQRKAMEAALQEREAVLQKAMSAPTVGVLFFSLDGGIQRVNETFMRMSGYSSEELTSTTHWRTLTAPEFWELTEREATALAERGEAPPYEKQMIRKDGSRWWGLFAPTRISGDGWSARCVEFIIDITERKQAEEALRIAHESAEGARQAAEDASKAKDQFLAVLSHELRNPLTPVLATAAMLQREPAVSEDQRDQIEIIRRNAELEARLIDDLLDVTRIARGKIELTRERTELCMVISRAVEVCKPDIDGRGIHFGIDWGPRPYWVDADIGRLQQVFWNLLSNAVKFTPRSGCVGVKCRPNENHVVVEVMDSGIGIPPEMLPAIFNPFEQVERTITRQFGGLGLGLTICKAMVELHGGTIEAHSEGRGKGATFRVRLPLQVPAGRGQRRSPASSRLSRPIPCASWWSRTMAIPPGSCSGCCARTAMRWPWPGTSPPRCAWRRSRASTCCCPTWACPMAAAST